MQRLTAPAKLTLSLRITGVRDDGYHLLEAEMTSIDLADVLDFDTGSGLELVDEVVGGTGLGDLDDGPANLVGRALAAVGREAAVRLVKRIPLGAGLGGGSSDAAAVLRWAGETDPAVAAGLGADVPFCVVGGRARVGGIGDEVVPVPFVAERFLLLVPPVAVDTAAAYRAWDDGRRPAAGDDGGNDLEQAALAVAAGLGAWREAFGAATGARPRLAGSGSAWFVGDPEGNLARRVGAELRVGGARAPVVPVTTVPAPDATIPPEGAGSSVER
ncbi:MAG: 4-(cytidine 5'-diphospho)-2-C-methyl-D-erythritol kinase [Acidobacteriota bacterium]|nr:4-(cytidine 5'-diphospho)-2-C-methyl-D-erythritol kinase [Acidobacteriota bacterium]